MAEPLPAPQPPVSVMQAALHDALVQSWTAFHPIAALYCLPALVATLAFGEGAGERLVAVIVASAAFTVGFGAFQHLNDLRAAPMVLATIGSCLAAFVGTLASGIPGIEELASGLFAFGLGLFTALGTASWWVLLQCAIAEVIATTFPDDLRHAALRAGLVLAGGAVQIAIVVTLWRLAPRPFYRLVPPNEEPPPRTLRDGWRTLGRTASVSSERFRYCLSLGLSVALGVSLFRAIGLPNGYWMPMTILLVLRWGGLRVTLGRAIARCAGTLLAAALVTLLIALAKPSTGALIALITLAAWACFATQFVNYIVLSFAVTAYVVLLLGYLGLPEPVVALHRTLATLAGGVIALAGQIAIRGHQSSA